MIAVDIFTTARIKYFSEEDDSNIVSEIVHVKTRIFLPKNEKQAIYTPSGDLTPDIIFKIESEIVFEAYNQGIESDNIVDIDWIDYEVKDVGEDVLMRGAGYVMLPGFESV